MFRHTLPRVVASAALGAAILTGPLVAAPADAAQCSESASLVFNPRLTTASRSGTVTFISTRSCPLGGSTTQVFTNSYTGNCLHANIDGATLSIVAGGVLHVGIQGTPGANRILALVPDAVCNTGIATGTGVFVN